MESEEAYLRARNAGASSAPDGAAASSPPAEPEEPLDESVSAADAAGLKAAGNAHFGAGRGDAALASYGAALRSAHLDARARAVLHANVAAVHVRSGAWRDAYDAAGRALGLDAGYGKARARRRRAAEALGEWRVAAEDARAMGCGEREVGVLEGRAREKEERERGEAMDALKGLGNSLLSNFGMSLDNFKVEQDPESGGYNVQMR